MYTYHVIQCNENHIIGDFGVIQLYHSSILSMQTQTLRPVLFEYWSTVYDVVVFHLAISNMAQLHVAF